MNSKSSHPLRTFVDWLRVTDEHADHHVALIERVEDCLGAHFLANDETKSLADKLERWRYQHLHQRASRRSSRDEDFADALHLTATQLAGRRCRSPRRTHLTIFESPHDTNSLRAGADALDSSYPLEQLIIQASQVTADYFGTIGCEQPADLPRRKMLLYAPLYVSSHCVNYCTYCGFRHSLDIERLHLSMEDVREQIDVLQKYGFEHLLIVGGEFPSLTSTEYFCDIAQTMARQGIVPAIEIAPQSTGSYERLVLAGVHGLTLYQETYDERLYAEYHSRGPKANYHWRLESHDRAAEAGMRRLGLGVLLGLADPRQDILAMMRHGAYLLDRFPDRTLAFSLPRIHQAPSDFNLRYPISDEELIRFYCALRIAFPEAPLVLSTRESATLRNRLAEICITQMSAGSSTTPGGYGSSPPTTREQFPVSDQRSASEVAHWLDQAGFHVTWSL